MKTALTAISSAAALALALYGYSGAQAGDTTAAGAVAAAGSTADAAANANPAPGAVALTATLSGAEETHPGDPDAKGSFAATLDPATYQLCYALSVENFDSPTAAHIHVGAAGSDGKPVVGLEAPKDGASKACLGVEPDLAAKLIATPTDYYVNVHNAEFPKGGVRGQLK